MFAAAFGVAPPVLIAITLALLTAWPGEAIVISRSGIELQFDLETNERLTLNLSEAAQ